MYFTVVVISTVLLANPARTQDIVDNVLDALNRFRDSKSIADRVNSSGTSALPV